MSDEEEQQLLSDTATILKMDPPWDVTEDALHAAERALFAITKAVHHYKWHRQVLGDFWMAQGSSSLEALRCSLNNLRLEPSICSTAQSSVLAHELGGAEYLSRHVGRSRNSPWTSRTFDPSSNPPKESESCLITISPPRPSRMLG